eukprot:6660240-Pyramimonas_sp.AAC.1
MGKAALACGMPRRPCGGPGPSRGDAAAPRSRLGPAASGSAQGRCGRRCRRSPGRGAGGRKRGGGLFSHGSGLR